MFLSGSGMHRLLNMHVARGCAFHTPIHTNSHTSFHPSGAQVLDSNMSSYGSPFTSGTSAGAAAVVTTTTAAATVASPLGEAAGAAGNTVAAP